MTHRKTGRLSLQAVLKREQNVKIIENKIHLCVQKCIDTNTSNEAMVEMYNDFIFGVIGDILSKMKLSDILKNIKPSKLGWSHPCYNDMKLRIDEEDDFIEHPFDVEEGVLECRAIIEKTGKICRSKRVYSYTKQVRGSDEPMTTFATCCACNKKWQYSG